MSHALNGSCPTVTVTLRGTVTESATGDCLPAQPDDCHRPAHLTWGVQSSDLAQMQSPRQAFERASDVY